MEQITNIQTVNLPLKAIETNRGQIEGVPKKIYTMACNNDGDGLRKDFNSADIVRASSNTDGRWFIAVNGKNCDMYFHKRGYMGNKAEFKKLTSFKLK